MKKITCLFVLGILFSCASETEVPQASADAEIIRLMKTPDKNTLTHDEIRKIVAHLDKKPEDSKYLASEPISKKKPVKTLDPKAAKREYTIEDYMQVEVVPQNAPDYKATLQMIRIEE